MTHLIDKDVLVAEIERRKQVAFGWMETAPNDAIEAEFELCNDILSFLDTLEVKEVDLERLGEIARHLIAVKEHIEDMRLDKEEWLMLEKIGYPERFKAQKGE